MSGVLRAVVVLAMLGGFASFASPTATAGQSQTYIVVLDPGGAPVGAEAASLARQHGGVVGTLYHRALRGFTIKASPGAAAAIARSPRVAYVEADQAVALAAQTTPTGVRRIFAVDTDPGDPGNPANTNLDVDGVDDLRVDVDAAVIDTGIDLDNPDLNVVSGVNCLSGTCVTGGDDDHYHGTHVAGTIAALDNAVDVVGVAPGARLWAVKVLDWRGSGSNAGVIAGIDWVLQHNAAAPGQFIEVANMSLGGGPSSALDAAVANAVAAHVTMVVAAGNSAADASTSSPAREPSAITVSALSDFNGLPGGGAASTCRADVDDTFADFSNYGLGVDIIAPGVCITSTQPGGGTRTISGTSMASPHVAGAAALLRSVDDVNTLGELTGNGNYAWNDADDPDPVKEPLLDVSNNAVFAPVMIGSPTGPPPAELTFSGSATSQKSTWTARVTVSGATAGSTVAGTWSVGGTPSSCTAGSGGSCTISRSGLAKRVGSVTWTHTGTGQTVTIAKP